MEPEPENVSHLRSRTTQMGVIAFLKLQTSASAPVARQLVPRTVGAQRVRRVAMAAAEVSGGEASPPAGEDAAGDAHPPALDDQGAAAPGGGSTRAHPPPPRLSLHARRTPARKRTETLQERKQALTGIIGAALRRVVGMRTVNAALTVSGMMAKVVGSQKSAVRSLFCVVGPRAVDMASLWFSPAGNVLCSCWDGRENAALLSLTGKGSTCWHADCFRAALAEVREHVPNLQAALQVRPGTEAHAVDVELLRGRAAVAFDGKVFSPVVASRRQHIKCVAVCCRSVQRRCQHATLVRKLERFAEAVKDDDGSDGESDGVESLDEQDNVIDEEELVQITRFRARRNLLSCMVEDKLAEKWQRTSEWASAEDVPACLFAPPPSSSMSDDNALPGEPPDEPPPTTPVQRLARWGMAFDPGKALCETHCPVCGVVKALGTPTESRPADVIGDGGATRPLPVRSRVSLQVSLQYVVMQPSVVLCRTSATCLTAVRTRGIPLSQYSYFSLSRMLVVAAPSHMSRLYACFGGHDSPAGRC